MAYTILNTNGTVLTTIQDGTINTTSTSLGLPGRNYAGYGQTIDTNFVQMLENFAANTPPPNPIQGQLWFNTNNNTMYVCPVTGITSASSWLSLNATSSGNTTFGNVTVTGNVSTSNLSASGTTTSGTLNAGYLTVSNSANLANTVLANANVSNILTSTNITTGNATTSGNLTGVWNITGGPGGAGATALNFVSGGIQLPSGGTYGIKCDNYMYANGVSIPLAGSVTGLSSRANVSTTTSSIAYQSSAIATVTAAKGYALYSITASVGAWVVVYTSAAALAADSGRSISTPPTAGSGVIAQSITTTTNVTTYFTPAAYGFNAESPVNTNMYLKIYNNSGSTNPVTVTLTYVTLEI
jgi:hypothetical protein